MKFKIEKKLIYLSGLMCLLLLNAKTSFAQDTSNDDADISSVENVYSTPSSPATPKAKSSFKSNDLPSQLKGQPGEVRDLKDLSKLSPFREVSVIQKKFLPKTERFQFFVGGSILTNTPWYNNIGGKINLSYNFTETLGLELNTTFLTNSKRDASKEIQENNGLQAEQFIYTKSYYGLDFVWSPIYGKITSIDQKITPFDMYFALGAGTSKTTSREGNNSTLHLGLGQIFAISKGIAFRWDYSFNTFSATPPATLTSTSSQSSRYNDLVLTAGLSFFFPEASYR